MIFFAHIHSNTMYYFIKCFKLSLSITFLMVSTTIFAQSNQIEGTVKSENNQIINGASIVLYDGNKNTEEIMNDIKIDLLKKFNLEE